MEPIEPTAPRKGPLREMALNRGIDPDYRHPGGRWSKFTDDVVRAPEVPAVCGRLHSRGAPPTTGTSTASAAQDDEATPAGVHDNERAVSTTLREAGPGPANAVEHSAAADEVGSGLNRPAKAALALSSSVMPNDKRAPRPARAAPTGTFAIELDVLSALRPAGQLPKAVAPSVQTPMPTPAQHSSTQQARALTMDSRPASAARLADINQESSAPAAPNKNHIYNAESPAAAAARVRKLMDDFRNTGNKENVPPSSAAAPGTGHPPWRIPKPRYTREKLDEFLAQIDAILPATPAPAPASPAESDRPDSPSSSGPWTPRPSPSTRPEEPVDPDEDVPLLELPPAVYSVSIVAPKRIVVDSFLEYPDKLPIPFPINAEMLTLLRGQNPGGDEENANAGNVADDEDEPQEYALCPLIVPPADAA